MGATHAVSFVDFQEIHASENGATLDGEENLHVAQNGRVTGNFVFVICNNYLGVQRRGIHNNAQPVHSYMVVRDEHAVFVRKGAGE